MLGEWIRRTGFFVLDILKGGKVIKHYKDIYDKMNGKKDCLDVLPDILKYAKNNIPYYSNIGRVELSSFPVVKKSDYMANYDAFQSREFIGTKLHWVSTSGSTGTPFKASQDANKRNRTIAELIYFHKINCWNLGERYVFLRAWVSMYSVSKLRIFLQNYIAADVVNFNDEAKESLRQILKRDKKIRVILGYASAMESFVNYLEEKGDNEDMFSVKVIFTGSDNLSDTTKSKLEKMFGCPVISRFSNEEHGILACTSAYNKIFRLNTASYYFELLKLDSDEAAEPGEIGRIVVTDLYNHSMPFIRYDIGDLAISDDVDRKHITTFSSFQGRIADVIEDTKGNKITAALVNNYLHEFYKMKQYQLIQDDETHFLLKVVCDRDTYNVDDFLGVCKKFLGDTVNIDVQYVANIPVEKTGKYKTIINRYIQTS